MSTSNDTVQSLYPGLPTEATLPPQVPHETLIAWAKQLLDTLLDSVAAQQALKPEEYAHRSETALAEAATAAAFSEAVSVAVGALMPNTPGALTAEAQQQIATLAGELSDPDRFGQWAQLVARDHIYIAAMVLAERRGRRAARKEPQ